MKNLISRFWKEEEAELSMWITVILFLLIAVLAYLIIWPKMRDFMKSSVDSSQTKMNALLNDVNAGNT